MIKKRKKKKKEFNTRGSYLYKLKKNLVIV